MAKKDVLIYYLFNFLIGFYVANGTTVLFARQLDLSFSQIFTLSAVYMLMFVLFEIPTGAVADMAGRKKSLVIGCLVLAAAALGSGLSQNFWHLFSSFFLWALGFSLISGASEAMLYDKLGDEKLFHKVYGRALSFNIFGMALAGVIGPMLYTADFRYPYLASSVPFLLAGLAIAGFAENSSARRGFSLVGHWEQIKTGTRLAFQNRFVIWSMAVMALTFAVAYTFSNSYQPYLQEIGFAVKIFSLILPAMFVIEALGGFGSSKLTQGLGETKMFVLSLLGLGAALAVLGFWTAKASLSILLIYTFLQGAARPLISTYANRHIDSGFRATIVSVQSMIGTIAASAMLFLLGLLTDRVGVVKLTAVLGVIVLVCAAILLMFKPREKQSL